MVLWRYDVPEKGDARGVRWEWESGWESTLLEERGMVWGFMEGRPGRGISFEL